VRIRINGKEREFAQPALSVKDLIDQLSLAPQRIAIEVNRQIIPRAAWEGTQLDDGDRVEIVHFVGGGVSEARPYGRAT
jgi:thiamine biosynthesis protein ThiS